jgi:transposase InsO family protein
VSRFQFVADNSATFEVKRLCELVEIERSSYYAWLQAAPAREERARADTELAERIRAVHAEDKTCGAPRITAELNDGAQPEERVNHKRVARVMRLEGIRGYAKKRRVRTMIPEPSGHKHPDLLKRDFTADAPNRRYVGDITYLPLAEGSNLYLATVIDCYSRRLAGWAIADHMRTELVADALKAAAATRGSLKGAIFHSDHGSVYCSKDYAKLCKKLGLTQSMGAVGSSADNALAESFNATMKREVLQDAACWTDELTCRRQVFKWLVRYNTKRRHSWCRYAANRCVITPSVQDLGGKAHHSWPTERATARAHQPLHQPLRAITNQTP